MIPRNFHNLSSITPTAAIKIAKYAFRDYFIKLEKNIPERIYYLWLAKSINGEVLDNDILDDFLSFSEWNTIFKVRLLIEEDAKEYLENFK